MDHRGLRIASCITYFLAIVFLAIELFFVVLMIHRMHDNSQISHESEYEDYSMFGVVIFVVLGVWSIINVILGSILFYQRRKKSFPFTLAIIHIILVAPKVLLFYYLLYLNFTVIHSNTDFY